MSNDSTVSTLDDSAQTTAAKPKGAARAAAQAEPATEIDAPIGLSGKKKTVTIHPSEGDGGRDAVNIGLNGFMYQVPRGKPVKVPVEVLEVLKNAVTTKYRTEGKETVEYDVPRYAFSETD